MTLITIYLSKLESNEVNRIMMIDVSKKYMIQK